MHKRVANPAQIFFLSLNGRLSNLYKWLIPLFFNGNIEITFNHCDNTLEDDEALLYSLKGNIHMGNARVTATGEIVNDGYYDRVFALLKTLKRKNFVKEELMPLIKYGNIRPEQFWPTETLENMLASSSNSFFRSYLSLMILLSWVSPYEEEEDEEIEKNPYLL